MDGLSKVFWFVMAVLVGAAGLAIYQDNCPTGQKCHAMGGHYFMFEGICKITTEHEVRM